MYPKIVVFGDSITEFGSRDSTGIISRLVNAYVRKVDIVSRGLSGYNTTMARPYLGPFLDEIKAEIVAAVIFFGTNDAVASFHPQFVSISEYAANLTAMVNTAKSRTNLVIITGPTVVDETKTEQDVRTNQRAVQYSMAAAQVAKATGSIFVDLYAEFRKSNKESHDLSVPVSGQISYFGEKSVAHLVPDGIHFSSQAYTLWYDALINVLESENRAPNDFEYVIPEYRKVLGMTPKQ